MQVALQPSEVWSVFGVYDGVMDAMAPLKPQWESHFRDTPISNLVAFTRRRLARPYGRELRVDYMRADGSFHCRICFLITENPLPEAILRHYNFSTYKWSIPRSNDCIKEFFYREGSTNQITQKIIHQIAQMDITTRTMFCRFIHSRSYIIESEEDFPSWLSQ